MTKKTEGQLNELLEQKQARIDELEHAEQEREEQEEERRWKWSRHYEPDENLMNLPVPRLQMVWHKLDDYHCEWHYDLIYRHFLGHLVGVPMGHTSSSGGTGKPPIWEMDGGRDNKIKAGDFWLPHRDGAHIYSDAVQLGLPAFAIVDGKVHKLVRTDEDAYAQERFTPSKKPVIPVEIDSWTGGLIPKP